MTSIAENNREFERFDIEFPATVLAQQLNSRQNISTKDISAGGAFLQTVEPYEEGIKVVLELVISNATIKKLTGCESCIKVNGTVVRSDSNGMAIRFNDHKIMPLRSMMDH
jgi:LuxR family transcriptional regulator, positive regulator of biofilm formation